jgi:hypothetical protein
MVLHKRDQGGQVFIIASFCCEGTRRDGFATKGTWLALQVHFGACAGEGCWIIMVTVMVPPPHATRGLDYSAMLCVEFAIVYDVEHAQLLHLYTHRNRNRDRRICCNIASPPTTPHHNVAIAPPLIGRLTPFPHAACMHACMQVSIIALPRSWQSTCKLVCKHLPNHQATT